MGLREVFQKDPTLKKALAWGMAAGLLTAGYTLTLPNRYKSEILVLPQTASSSGPLAALSAVTGMLGGGGLGQADPDAFYTDIVNSRWLGEKLLDTPFTFSYQAWYFGAVQARKQTLAEFLEADTPKKRESALKTVLDWTDAKKDLKTGVLTLSAEAPSPELAQELVNRTADLLDLALTTRVQTQGTAKADYARQRLAKARQEQEQARLALVAFAQSHQNFAQSPDPAIRSKGESLAADLVLRGQVTTSVALGYEQAELDARNTVPVLSRLSDAYLPATKSGPKRANLVLAAMAIGAGLYWGWVNRARLRGSLQAIEAARSPQPGA
jgi:uncharacterized protein involved in exopolysaccharide biosynthesis